MFQSAYSIKAKNKIGGGSVPETFIKSFDILYVKTLYFDEHCLECSAPLCYGTCENYKKRNDLACRLLHYGIRHLKEKDTLTNVMVKFRPWGKLESRINKGCLNVNKIKRLDRIDRVKTKLFLTASKIFTKKDYSLTRKFDGLKRRKYSLIKEDSPFVNDFLFQCKYSGETFNLIFEIADRENKVVFKRAIVINDGYNQELIKIDFSLIEGGLVRIYPENNKQVELQIFACDFVQLKSEIPNAPAKKVKCVCWDLDNTIWQGILAESSMDSLCLRENVLDTIKELDSKGIIQVIVSKNDRENVIENLKRLGIIDYFVLIYASWQSKGYSIYSASRVLNINLDTFAFIDDSIFERNEVSSLLPCVRVYKEDNLKQTLALSEFDVKITLDSANRRLSYLKEIERNNQKALFLGDNVEFIKSCKIEAKITTNLTNEQKNRSYELLSRTNQLNLSAKKYSVEEFNQLINDKENNSLVINVSDKFGDYGQVAFILYKNSEKIEITEFALSCRVAGKFIENAIFDYFLQKEKKDIVLTGRRTDRNITLVNAFIKAGLKNLSNEKEIHFELNKDSKLLNSSVVKIYEK